MKLLAKIPPTNKCGSCKITGTSSYLETAKQNILWTYNNMLQHDGEEAVKKLPNGTKYSKL
jgi:hypothetical protein